jgi:hypothetical protein
MLKNLLLASLLMLICAGCIGVKEDIGEPIAIHIDQGEIGPYHVSILRLDNTEIECEWENGGEEASTFASLFVVNVYQGVADREPHSDDSDEIVKPGEKQRLTIQYEASGQEDITVEIGNKFTLSPPTQVVGYVSVNGQ